MLFTAPVGAPNCRVNRLRRGHLTLASRGTMGTGEFWYVDTQDGIRNDSRCKDPIRSPRAGEAGNATCPYSPKATYHAFAVWHEAGIGFAGIAQSMGELATLRRIVQSVRLESGQY